MLFKTSLEKIVLKIKNKFVLHCYLFYVYRGVFANGFFFNVFLPQLLTFFKKEIGLNIYCHTVYFFIYSMNSSELSVWC